MDRDAGRDNWFVGARAPFGQWNFKASYGGTNGKDLLDNVDATQWALGVDYNLSKRTALYATWSSINNDNAAFSVAPGWGAAERRQQLDRRFGRRASHLLIGHCRKAVVGSAKAALGRPFLWAAPRAFVMLRGRGV